MAKTLGLVLSGEALVVPIKWESSPPSPRSLKNSKLNDHLRSTLVSAGAINATYLAAGLEDFATTTEVLVQMWSKLSADQIFYTSTLNIGKIGLGADRRIILRALLGTTPGRSL